MFWHWVLLYLFVSIGISGTYTVLMVVGGYVANTTVGIWVTFAIGIGMWPVWLLLDLGQCATDMLFGVPEDDDAD